MIDPVLVALPSIQPKASIEDLGKSLYAELMDTTRVFPKTVVFVISMAIVQVSIHC